MNIKDIVIDICSKPASKRLAGIINYLNLNKIDYKILKYSKGINLEVIVEGVNSQEIIFFSHYDIANSTNEGANDNTSSVAVMINILIFLKNYKPYNTIRIVFNDNEEYLGALLTYNLDKKYLGRIIEYVGSYHYLKNNVKKNKIQGIFIVELSGIGDSIYIAEKSGNVICDKKLNLFLINLVKEMKYKFNTIPVPNSDMLSVFILGYKGVVVGAVPSVQVENDFVNKNKNNIKNKYPVSWQKNHTNFDNYFSIHEKSLVMIYDYIKEIIKNLDKM